MATKDKYVVSFNSDTSDSEEEESSSESESDESSDSSGSSSDAPAAAPVEKKESSASHKDKATILINGSREADSSESEDTEVSFSLTLSTNSAPGKDSTVKIDNDKKKAVSPAAEEISLPGNTSPLINGLAESGSDTGETFSFTLGGASPTNQGNESGKSRALSPLVDGGKAADTREVPSGGSAHRESPHVDGLIPDSPPPPPPPAPESGTGKTPHITETGTTRSAGSKTHAEALAEDTTAEIIATRVLSLHSKSTLDGHEDLDKMKADILQTEAPRSILKSKTELTDIKPVEKSDDNKGIDESDQSDEVFTVTGEGNTEKQHLTAKTDCNKEGAINYSMMDETKTISNGMELEKETEWSKDVTDTLDNLSDIKTKSLDNDKNKTDVKHNYETKSVDADDKFDEDDMLGTVRVKTAAVPERLKDKERKSSFDEYEPKPRKKKKVPTATLR